MFIIEYGGRLTDNRSSCVIMKELTQKANLKPEDSLGFRKYITNNGKQLILDNLNTLIDKTRRNDL